ncbi:MAG: GntR family transcriptional regulator, partial [Alphaproteobacteria bacterium]|nr:GntR family transcriptional regulator [Alphaproteobacteria bacterium]
MGTVERARRPRRPGGRSALQAELVRQILAEIGRTRLAAGTAVRELPLAERFGVSRTPVRAALRVLEAMGYLAFAAGRGFTLLRAVADAEADDELLPRSAFDDLHQAILTDRARGQLPTEVSEAALMPRYGVSRGIVRRVLMKLADDGIVRRQRGHGWRFMEALDSPAALAESYRFRIIIECASLAEPTFAHDPDEMRRLRELHHAILRDVDGLDPKRWFEANNAFHEAIATWSHNRFLAEAMRRQNALRQLEEHFSFRRITTRRIIQSSREHLAVLDAIEKGDRAWASSLLERHLALTARAVAEREARDAAAAERRRAASDDRIRTAGRSASAGRSAPR